MAVPGKSTSAMRLAIRACLVQCHNSDSPMTSLADSLEKLADLGWDRETIAAVKRGVVVLLNAQHSDDSLFREMAG